MEMEWWDKMMIPMRKVWAKVSKRVGFREIGLAKLDEDVRTCEYKDVHVLWDILQRNQMDHLTRSISEEPCWRCHWAKCTPLLYRGV